MFTKTTAAVMIAGAAAFFTMSSVHAQSYEQCDELAKGQRSFCMIDQWQTQAAQQAKTQNKDVTVNYDYDTSNDTPAQTAAKKAYSEAAEKCAELAKGQRGFCMDQATMTYNSAMGN